MKKIFYKIFKKKTKEEKELQRKKECRNISRHLDAMYVIGKSSDNEYLPFSNTNLNYP
jgi:hypothetical protein